MSKAGKQWDRFKFKFNECMLIACHVPCTVLGIAGDTRMRKLDPHLGEIAVQQGRQLRT